jgi:PQQ-dependent catabolism-associated CXXCW motif protein
MRARLAVSLVLIACAAAAGEGTPPEPAGYRGEPYRAPVPATLHGAQVLDDAGARRMWEDGTAAFVDAMPRPPKPALPEGTVWRDKPHPSIPGAIWLPNVGYDALDPDTLAYLRAGLAQATGGDRARPLVIFCKSECWMSWNAAKRAVEDGYARVFWYPEGVDGWAAAGGRLEPARPWSAP